MFGTAVPTNPYAYDNNKHPARGGGVICPDRESSGSPRVARGPKFKIPFPRSCVPRPVEPKFHRRRPSGLGALRVLKLLTPRG